LSWTVVFPALRATPSADDHRRRPGDGPDADGRNAPIERVAELALGADDYPSKSLIVPLSGLVLHVRALARCKPSSKRRALHAAGIELDQIAHTASRGGRQLDLSNKDSGVLEALLKASLIPVSAEITRIR
jgi:DNA-binding response OmpR family regulator